MTMTLEQLEKENLNQAQAIVALQNKNKTLEESVLTMQTALTKAIGNLNAAVNRMGAAQEAQKKILDEQAKQIDSLLYKKTTSFIDFIWKKKK